MIDTLRSRRLPPLRAQRDCRMPCALRSRRLQAQASIEMAVALVGALLLLFGALKLCLWFNGRYLTRYEAYERSRADAGGDNTTAPYEPDEPLDLFKQN